MKKIIVLLITGSFVFISCKKTGPTGANGIDGNANVKSQNSTISNWSWDPTNFYLYNSVAVPALSTEIFNTGEVMVHIQTTSGEWAPLPRTYALNDSVSMMQRFVYSAGTVRVILQKSDLTQPPNSPYTFKIICVACSGKTVKPTELNYIKADQ